MDRTDDFTRLLASAAESEGVVSSSTSSSSSSSAGPGSSAALSPSTAIVRTQLSQGLRKERQLPFHAVASSLSNDLVGAYEKLERLTELCRSSNVSFDPADEIAHLQASIKDDITRMKDQLDKLSNHQPHTNQQVSQHADAVLRTLQKKLVSAQQRFLRVLEARKDTLKRNFERKRELFGSVSSSLSRRKANNPLYSKMTPIANSANDGENESVAITMPQMSLVTEERVSRAEAVESIQGTIEELGSIFDHINLLVAQQGEMIDRIDDNVEVIAVDVDRAHNALMKNWKNLNSGRWLYAKVFGVILLFVMIFLIFFV